LAPKDVLDKAGVKLAENYPRPIVDHSAARDLALDAFAKIRRARTAT
jgi:deoxyribodipyrimidine photo-lyase